MTETKQSDREPDERMHSVVLASAVIKARGGAWTAREAVDLVNEIHSELTVGLSVVPGSERKPAVPIDASVFPDGIICLESGKKLKLLKRHLKNNYGLTPDQYREKWHLPADYPMAAPNYSKARSEMAKRIGLGKQKRG